AAAEGDHDLEAQELIRRLGAFDPAQQRLEHLPRPTRIPRDARRDGELIVGGTTKRLVAQLSGEALRDGERLYGFATAMDEVECRSRVGPEAARVADRQSPRVEQPLRAPKCFRRGCEREETGDRLDLELALAARPLDVRVVEEERCRPVELL